VARRGEPLREIVAREVDCDELHLARRGRERADALALVALRVRVIDLEHHRVAQLGHAPRAAVEPRAQDDDLRRVRLAHRVVYEQRAHRHHRRARSHELVAESRAKPRRRTVAKVEHARAPRPTTARTPSDPRTRRERAIVRDRARDADEDRGLTGLPRLHGDGAWTAITPIACGA
jgi:hypothetical protein